MDVTSLPPSPAAQWPAVDPRPCFLIWLRPWAAEVFERLRRLKLTQLSGRPWCSATNALGQHLWFWRFEECPATSPSASASAEVNQRHQREMVCWAPGGVCVTAATARNRLGIEGSLPIITCKPRPADGIWLE